MDIQTASQAKHLESEKKIDFDDKEAYRLFM